MLSSGGVVSRSEYGSFLSDGDADMRVLRKRAQDAVRWWNDGKPRKEMEGPFGIYFSVISDGKLVDSDFNGYKGRLIERKLSLAHAGIYEGHPIMSYDDWNKDGGCASVLIGDVTNVEISGDRFIVEGTDLNGRRPIRFVYRIQDVPDSKIVFKPLAPQPLPPRPAVREKPIEKEPEKPKKTVRKKPEPKKTGLVYEVRDSLTGEIKGTFSSKSQATKLKKEVPYGRIYTVFR